MASYVQHNQAHIQKCGLGSWGLSGEGTQMEALMGLGFREEVSLSPMGVGQPPEKFWHILL